VGEQAAHAGRVQPGAGVPRAVVGVAGLEVGTKQPVLGRKEAQLEAGLHAERVHVVGEPSVGDVGGLEVVETEGRLQRHAKPDAVLLLRADRVAEGHAVIWTVRSEME
jgi:hypothetical protein